MKIVFCANTSWYVYNFRCNLIAAIQEKGHDVAVITPYDAYTEKIVQLGIEWFHLPLQQAGTNPCRECYSFTHLGYLLHKIQPQLVLTFTTKCNLYTGILAYLLPFAFIPNISGLGELFTRQTRMTRGVYVLYRQALRHARKVFFQNDDDVRLFLQKKIVPEHICERLPGSGVDLTMFTPAPHSSERQARIFLMFGRLLPQKGYDLFLNAARNIRQTQSNRAEFWVLGIRDAARKASDALFQKVLDYHAQDIITYFPATDNVVPILQQADVVVLPSQYHEGVPKSLLEALSCGKPILTTNWKGCRDTVDDGKNGYLINLSELHLLEKYLQTFIDADGTTLQRMGRASRQKAEQEFDEQLVLAKYLTEIGEAL